MFYIGHCLIDPTLCISSLHRQIFEAVMVLYRYHSAPHSVPDNTPYPLYTSGSQPGGHNPVGVIRHFARGCERHLQTRWPFFLLFAGCWAEIWTSANMMTFFFALYLILGRNLDICRRDDLFFCSSLDAQLHLHVINDS